MRLVPAIILAVSILLAPLIWHFSRSLFAGPGGIVDSTTVDSEARIEIEMMRAQLEQLRDDIKTVNERAENALALASARPSVPVTPLAPGEDPLTDDGPNIIVDAYAQVVLIANRRNVNKGLTVPSRSYLVQTLGRPRDVLGDDCQGITNARLKELVFLGDVGPIRVRMLKPAVESLRRVFERVRATDQDLYDRINTSGSLCVRRIRGTQSTLSSHAFGLALDINIDGQLDTLGDGRTQLGLTIMADFFKEEKWIWGAGFGREDSMHFEVSQELLEDWVRSGQI